MKNKTISVMLIVLALIIMTLFVHLISGGRNQDKVNDPLTDAEKKVETLHFMHWTNFPRKLINDFSIRYPDIKVEFERINSNLYPEAQRVRLSSGENLDVMGVMESDYSAFVRSGFLVNLTGKDFISNYSPESINELKKMLPGGAIYSVPYKSWVIGVWYNKILLSKYNIEVPKDVEGFFEACRKLKSNGVDPLVLGCRDNIESSYLYYLSILNAGGGDAQWSRKLASGDVKWTDGKMMAASRYTDRIVNEGYLTEESLNLTYQQAFSEFLRGNAAMCITGDWSAELCEQNSDKFVDLGVFALPYNEKGVKQRVPGVKAGFLTGIFSSSKNLPGAELFLKYISEPEAAEVYSSETGTHTNIMGDVDGQKYDAIWNGLRKEEFVAPVSVYLDYTHNMAINKSVKSLIVEKKSLSRIYSDFEKEMGQ